MTKNQHSPARFTIFDMDGLLLDTERVYSAGTNAVVERYGKQVDLTMRADMIGRPRMDSARYLVDSLGLPITPQQYLDEREGYLREHFPSCQPLPGVVALLENLKANNVPMAVGTSSDRELFEIKTSNHGDLFSLFDCVVTSSDPDVVEGKPAPDIFNVAAKQLGADPALSLVFEDSPAGIQAGNAAQMRVIAIPDQHMDRARFSDAYQILDSMEHFDPVAFGLV